MNNRLKKYNILDYCMMTYDEIEIKREQNKIIQQDNDEAILDPMVHISEIIKNK